MTSGYVDAEGNDLDSVFAPLVGAPIDFNTGYQVSGVDLKERYLPYTTGPMAEVTGYEVDGADLNTIFSKAIPLGFQYRFLNPGGAVPFKKSAITPTNSMLVYGTGLVTLAAYPCGEADDGNFSPADQFDIVYVSGITIPDNTESTVDDLWNDLETNAIPSPGAGISTGTADYTPVGGLTIGTEVTCDVPTSSAQAYLDALVAAPVIVIIGPDFSTVYYESAAARTEDDLWAAFTAAAIGQGFYSGTNQVMLVPVCSIAGGYTDDGPPPQPVPVSGVLFSVPIAGAAEPISLALTVPHLWIERFIAV